MSDQNKEKDNINFKNHTKKDLVYEKSEMGEYISEEARQRKRNIRIVSSGEAFVRQQEDKVRGRKVKNKKPKKVKTPKAPKTEARKVEAKQPEPRKAEPRKSKARKPEPKKAAPAADKDVEVPKFVKTAKEPALLRQARKEEPKKEQPPKQPKQPKKPGNPGRRISLVKVLLIIVLAVAVGIGCYKVYNVYQEKQKLEQDARDKAKQEEQNQNVKKNQWVEADGKSYYYGEDGMPTIGRFVLEDKIYYTNNRGAVEKTIDSNKPMVALTFDDGPTGVSEDILDVLEEYDVQATFFEIGNRIEDKEEIEERALKLHCQLGNHTYTNKLSETDEEKISTEISQTDAILNRVMGISEEEADKNEIYVRTPNGVINETILSAVNHPIILWTVDTNDWQSQDVDEITEIATTDISDGDIIMLTALKKPTAEALKKIVPNLTRQGFQLVNVQDLAQFRGGVEKGRAYISFPPSGGKTTTQTPTSATTEVTTTTTAQQQNNNNNANNQAAQPQQGTTAAAAAKTTEKKKVTTEKKKPATEKTTAATSSPSPEPEPNPGDSQVDGED